MALRFLADDCISNFIIQRLREAKHEVLRLKDLLPAESPDTAVIAKAQEIDELLVSLNGDFADIVAYPPKSYKGIVALQVRNHSEILPRLMTRLIAFLELHPMMDHYRIAANCSSSKWIASAFENRTITGLGSLQSWPGQCVSGDPKLLPTQCVQSWASSAFVG